METKPGRGWLLDVGGGGLVAAGGHQVVEYVRKPKIVTLPLTPAHCPGVFVWRGAMIPVVNLGLFFDPAAQVDVIRDKVVVLAYQTEPRVPLGYGAVLVSAVPEEVFVGNDMACPLPDNACALRFFACSCFEREGQPVPVVDPLKIFNQSLPAQFG